MPFTPVVVMVAVVMRAAMAAGFATAACFACRTAFLRADNVLRIARFAGIALLRLDGCLGQGNGTNCQCG